LGIIIEEHSYIDNVEAILVERYPVFNYNSFPYIMDIGGPSITPRSDGAVKDEELWERFLSSDTLVMPPVLISLPNENYKVYVSLYDRQGNESNKFKVFMPER